MARLTPQQLIDEIEANFVAGAKRKFLPGLLIAFINFLRELGATGGKYRTLKAFYRTYPRQTTTRSGGQVNTLIVKVGANKTLSIRKFYDQIQDWFRGDQKRFDYPQSAPHATQAWSAYEHWIEALLGYSEKELDWLDSAARSFVLAHLPAQGIDPESVKRGPPVFLLFLDDFDLSKHAGETTGAAYQGTVFGYIRADAPHLQVDVGKVRAGSKRQKRVGDVDARDGASLVLSAEVKQFVFGPKNLPDVAEFSKLISEHKALGLVVALDFEVGVRAQLEGLGLQPMSIDDLKDRVKLWDPLKQRIAVRALLYYVSFKEQNSALYARILKFLTSLGVDEE